MAKIAQIIIGDELLSGKIQDLNIKWLADYLLSTSHDFISSEIIGDDESQIKNSFARALELADIVIVTGGLGPTRDDKTKMVLMDFLKSELTESEFAKNFVKAKYASFNKEWTEETNDYHLIPKGVTALENPRGLAPGLMTKLDDKLLLCAPGVPHEFQAMMEQVFTPIIDENFVSKESGIKFFNIRTQGIPEEKIFGELCPTLWDDLSKYGSVSSLPLVGAVDITLRLKDDHNYESYVEQIKDLIDKSLIKDSVWQYGMEDLPTFIISQAKKKGLTISLAESCTGGLCASKLTDISGSSSVFLGSVVAYANDVKINLLNVNEDTLKGHGAVSAQTAKEMAIGVREATRSDISISFTGIAGPGGGSEEKPVGTVGIGWSSKLGDDSTILYLKGDRLRLKERFATKGLFKLLEIIQGL